ncbi:MAG: TolC family protein [Cyclobacteriaceae bacterium]
MTAMNRLQISFLLSILLIPFFGIAQDSSVTYSLNEAIEYALQHQESMQLADLDIQSAEKDIKATLADGLPQINGSGRLTRNFNFRSNFGPGGTGFFSQIPAGQVGSFAFGVPYEGDISANATQLLFNASYFIGLKASKTYKELAKRQKKQSEIEVVANVSKAYYGVLIAEERLDFLNVTLNQIKDLMETTKKIYEVGLEEEINFQQVEINYNNTLNEKQNLERVVAYSYNILQFQMGMDLKESITLSDSISEDVFKEKEETAVLNYSNRVEYGLLNTTIQLQRLNEKNFKGQYLPSLSLFGTTGAVTGGLHARDLFKTNNWFNYSLVGLSMNLPIFDGFRKSANIQKAKVEIKKLEVQRSQLEKQIDLELAQANIAYYNSLEKLTNVRNTLTLAKSVYNSSIKKQKIGAGSQQEVLNVRSIYKEAETNYYSTLYDLIIGKIDRDKAMGVLIKNE